MHGASVPPVAETTQRPPVGETTQRSDDSGQELNIRGELIPGLPDHITLNKITPKLPWTSFRVLSSVTRAWEEAIQRQLVYDARASTNSTETLVVIVSEELSKEDRKEMRKVIVYSMKNKAWWELPPIPDVREGFPICCQCISLYGKIYVLGGDKWLGGRGIKDVYVLDLAGQWKWKKCASMLKPRQQCGVAIMHGKIYIFGGICDFKSDLGAEVYDPKADSWSSIKSMKSTHFGPQVAALEDELVIYSGQVLIDPTGVSWRTKVPVFLEIYHPGRNAWRVIKSFGRRQPDGIMISAKGKYYVISSTGCNIYVLDTDTRQTWKPLQSSSFPGIRLADEVDVRSCLAVDDELFLLVSLYDTDRATGGGVHLVQSTGFLQGSKELVWQTLKCPDRYGLDFDNCTLLCSARL